MQEDATMSDATSTPSLPELRDITRADIEAALQSGWSDFRAAPGFGLFFGGVFTVIGLVLLYMLAARGSVLWILPLIGGFPLIGPFMAIGLYEISRRREAGEPLAFGAIIGAVFRERRRELPYMAVVVAFFLLAWLLLARIVLAVSFGPRSMGNPFLSADVLLSPDGLTMLLIGSVIGTVLALLLFAITAVSIPLLLDRDIDVVTAMITSYEAVNRNRDAMLFWGIIIAGLTVLAMIPYFLGMLIVFPVLGHATWHVYRRVVAPAPDDVDG